jgi:hypothetical protein
MERKEHRVPGEIEYGRLHLGAAWKLQRTCRSGQIPDADGRQGLERSSKESDKDITSKHASSGCVKITQKGQ